MDKFKRGLPRRVTRQHSRFQRGSRARPVKHQQQPAHFKKLQAIYETENIQSIEELDIENQKKAQQVVDSNNVPNFPVSTVPLYIKTESSKFTEDVSNFLGSEGSSKGSFYMSHQNSISTFSVQTTPRRSRNNSYIVNDDCKMDEITDFSRSFRMV